MVGPKQNLPSNEHPISGAFFFLTIYLPVPVKLVGRDYRLLHRKFLCWLLLSSLVLCLLSPTSRPAASHQPKPLLRELVSHAPTAKVGGTHCPT